MITAPTGSIILFRKRTMKSVQQNINFRLPTISYKLSHRLSKWIIDLRTRNRLPIVPTHPVKSALGHDTVYLKDLNQS